MSEIMKGREETFEVTISFPKAPKKAKDRESLFNKTLRLIEENKESIPAKLVSNKREKGIVLDSDEFTVVIQFGKELSAKAIMKNPDKNLKTVNNVGNNIINFLNVVLEELANSSEVSSLRMIFPEKPMNLAKKIVGTTQLARMNQTTKQVLNPLAIMLDYKVGERDFTFSDFSTETIIMENLMSRITYKDRLPFDLLQREYAELNNPSTLVKTILEAEL